MFYCKLTKRLSKSGESAAKLVTHVRAKVYTRWNHKTAQDEAIGEGVEIVREVLVSKEHYAKLMAEGFQPQVAK